MHFLAIFYIIVFFDIQLANNYTQIWTGHGKEFQMISDCFQYEHQY